MMAFKYTYRMYGGIKYLVYTHRDGVELLSTNIKGLVETIKAYNSIYHKEGR